MKNITKKLLALLLITTLAIPFVPASIVSAQSASKNIIAYFPNWGIYSASHKNMTVDMIPWDKITVVNHAFFEVDSSFKLASIDSFADFDKTMAHSEGWNGLKGHFGEYKYYKTQHPNTKVLISIGGWTRGQNFHAMAMTPATRATFITSLIDFLAKYPFIDGFDIDWEYPGVNRAADPNDQYDRGCPGGPEDKQNFTLLLKEIREAYNANNMPTKTLTIAITGGYEKIELQEPSVYAQYLDWINVMTYDFHGAWETTTGHQAGLYPNPNDTAGSSPIDIKGKYNTDSIMRIYRDQYGIPASKLNVGTPYYSRGWSGVTGGTNGMFGTATGAATGTWDNPQSPGGQFPYFTLKTMENQNGYVKYRDDFAKTPWLYNQSTGILLSYEDMTSLSTRCDYINSNNYGGLIIWDISGDTDNFEMTNLIHSKLIGTNPIQTVATPSFSPTGGTFSVAQSVTISCATAGATIRYTTDGTQPTATSAQYNGAINVASTTTLNAKAFKTGMTDSVTASATYTISSTPIQTVATPSFSPIGGTFNVAQSVTISCATAGATIRYTTDGTQPTATSTQYNG
ncbi:MAG: glycosyl hydrolase family 18 protein, partial [Oscillospiraceae bacterium]